MGALMDFQDLAARASGPKRRQLVEPWLGRATFDKVTRQFTVGIRPVPALASFLPLHSPGLTGRNEVGLIVRSTSLLQPGHEHHVREAAEAMRADIERRSVG